MIGQANLVCKDLAFSKVSPKLCVHIHIPIAYISKRMYLYITKLGDPASVGINIFCKL